MSASRLLLAALLCAAVPALEAATKPIPPAKAVRQVESRLKRLIEEGGEDRPSVHAARMELVQALHGLESCDSAGRIDRELASVAAWIERFEVPVRVSPQLVYNEIGRAAQSRARCTEDAAQRRAHHEAALQAFARSRAAAKRGYDAESEAVALFNASMSAEALGDLPQAIALMEEACAIDREYALQESYAEDYRELVRLRDARSGKVTPTADIEAHLAPRGEETIRLTFRPRHGDRQRYRSELRQVKMVDGEQREQRFDLEYAGAMAVQDDLVTITVRPEQSKVGGQPIQATLAGDAPMTAEDLVARLLARPVSYTVRTNGEFVGATGLEEVRRFVLGEVERAFAAQEVAGQRERARQLVEQLLSDAAINQQIASEWTTAVGWWVDAELDLGDWYTLDVDAPQPALPGATLKYTYRFKVNRRVACSPADGKRACVELIIESSPDREQFADYVVAFTAQMAGPQPRRQTRWYRERLTEDVQLVERSVLVVEPDTLKAHHHLKTRISYVPAAERGAHPRIELRTVASELQAPAREPKRPRAPAGTAQKRTKQVL